MFGIIKLKKEVKNLKTEVEKLKWINENPCPYKVGQKLKNGDIIKEVELLWSKYHVLENRGLWIYRTVKPLK